MSGRSFDYQQVPAGQSLVAFEPTFKARSLRIDNPTGCWYVVDNNKQIVPPFTYGLVIVLPAESRSLNIRFLASFAGQQSKIIGDPLQVFISDQELNAQNPLSIASAIPYVNTFAVTTTVADAGTVTCLLSIFPTASMRLRLVYFSVSSDSFASDKLSNPITIASLSADGSGAAVASNSQDGDPITLSQCTVRKEMLLAQQPTISATLRYYPWLVAAGEVQPRLSRSWDALGPDMPPSAYSSASSALRGIGLFKPSFALVHSWSVSAVWTEEPLS